MIKTRSGLALDPIAAGKAVEQRTVEGSTKVKETTER